jgi:two-component system response regulator AtoC
VETAAALNRAPAPNRATPYTHTVNPMASPDLAVQWRERERARREKLEPLLPTIASALDVREVFPTMSAVIQDVLPHETLILALVDPDGKNVTIHASVNVDAARLTRYRVSEQSEDVRAGWRFFLAYDLEAVDQGASGILRARVSPPDAPEETWIELRPGPLWTRAVSERGLRSTLRVPIRVQGETTGVLAFSSCAVDAYGEEDVSIASRIADHVSLALAHERLAEEARRTSLAVERANQLEARVDTLSREIEERTGHRALGKSEAWRRSLGEATRVSNTETTVLLTGESGTGKEVLARLIHRGSRRANRPFVAVNCAALPEQLIESELFGHERGAFTGALQARVGKIEQAAGGTLFLDEIGEMPLAMQAKLLRVLQEREFERVGGSKTLRADVRVVAATNREPHQAIARGVLREDLYYRLSAFEIALPPLRERREDIGLLAEAFLEEIGRSVGRPAAGLSQDARDRLGAHHWPGNVRELKNAIERAVILSEGGLVTGEHLPLATHRTPPSASAPAIPAAAVSAQTKLHDVQRALIEKALADSKGNRSHTARLLGLSRGELYTLLRRYSL